jgi:hypothetical protein
MILGHLSMDKIILELRNQVEHSRDLTVGHNRYLYSKRDCSYGDDHHGGSIL